jgi:hypothetical protein
MRGLLLRLRGLLSRRAVDEELDDELRLHLELETEKGLRHGLSPEEARRQAHVRFGAVERFREETRSARGLAVVDGLARDGPGGRSEWPGSR